MLSLIVIMAKWHWAWISCNVKIFVYTMCPQIDDCSSEQGSQWQVVVCAWIFGGQATDGVRHAADFL